MLRTSLTHPLRIDAVSVPGGGRLGLSFCPGKQQSGAMTGDWARNLAADLDAIATWGAVQVMTLLEVAEMQALGVPELGPAVQARGMDWLHLALPNDAVPDADFLDRWRAARERVHQQLDAGSGIFIHCMGGIGRTSTLAGMILIERGLAPADAQAAVCAARAGSFCVPAQITFLHAYPVHLSQEAA